jgi:hemerythrin
MTATVATRAASGYGSRVTKTSFEERMQDAVNQNDVEMIETMDREHQVQVGLIDALQESLRGGRDVLESAAIFERLLDYSRAHFLSEQLLMQRHSYPDYERHVADHEKMLDVLGTFGLRLRDGRQEDAVQEVVRLRAFLLGHIEGRDREFHEHLESL